MFLVLHAITHCLLTEPSSHRGGSQCLGSFIVLHDILQMLAQSLKSRQSPDLLQLVNVHLNLNLQESMRLQPVAANSLRRLVVRDIRLSNGVTLPAGVGIEMAQYSIFRNPAWGWEDPMSFKPVSRSFSPVRLPSALCSVC